MKTIFFLCLLGACSQLIISCSTSNLNQKKYQKFTSRKDYKKTYDTYRNEEVLKRANSSNTKVKIDLSDQRAQLLVTDEVALDLPCSTGKAGKRTSTGQFKIKKKVANKRSNIFGRFYRGNRVVYGGDRRKYHGSGRFIGSPLPYWMRLTDGGIGMHYSAGVRRYPCSNGCIRMPREDVKTIFAKTKVGTPVEIVH